MIDVVRALGVMAEPPGPQHDRIARSLGLPVPSPAEYTELFLLQLFPYASVQVGPEGKIGGEARDRVAGFLRALGCRPPAEPDHLAVLLGAYAALLEHEKSADHADRAAWAHAREAFLHEHVVSWVPAFIRRVAELGAPAYRGWADLLDDLLVAETARAMTVARAVPLHLRDVPAVTDPRRDAADTFVEDLLAPARAGMIVTAADLTRAAAELRLGLRVGDRRFLLRSLLDQDPSAVLCWLGHACAETAAGWRTHWLSGSPTAAWWSERATTTARLLVSLALAAREPVGVS